MAWFGGGKKKAAERKVLRVGTLAAHHGLDPRKTQDLGTVFVLTQVFESPYALPAADDSPAEPLLFTGMEASDGGNTLTATVRPGVKFSDGTPLTASHVAESLGRTEVLARAADVQAQGDKVAFRLRRPNRRFDLVLAQSYSCVVLEKDGKLLGTGPFMVAEAAGEVLRLVKNPHYRTPVPLDEIDFKVFPNADALSTAVEAGEIDFTGSLSRDDVGKIREARKLFPPGASTAILYFNTERPYLAATDTRKALALAIDRLEVTRTSYANALAFAASSLLPPMMGSFRDGLSPNLDRARELLAPRAAELPPRLRLVLVWGPRPYLPQPKTAAGVIARQLGALGVGVEVVTTANVEEYNRKVRGGDYDLLLTGWVADTLDPADYLDANLHSELVPTLDSAPVNRANRSRWRSRQMDAALARHREQRSEEARAEVLRLVSDEVPLLPLMYGPTVVVHAWRVKNFEPSPLGLPNLATVDLEG